MWGKSPMRKASFDKLRMKAPSQPLTLRILNIPLILSSARVLRDRPMASLSTSASRRTRRACVRLLVGLCPTTHYKRKKVPVIFFSFIALCERIERQSASARLALLCAVRRRCRNVVLATRDPQGLPSSNPCVGSGGNPPGNDYKSKIEEIISQ